MAISDDPFVRELLPEFIDTWIEDLNTQFVQLVEEQNSDDLYRMAHTLKGSCFQFGLDEIAQLGIQLMGIAKQQDWETALQYRDQMLSIFQDVKKSL